LLEAIDCSILKNGPESPFHKNSIFWWNGPEILFLNTKTKSSKYSGGTGKMPVPKHASKNLIVR
jgi:hypothetical protein